MFSRRTAWDRTPSALTRAVARARREQRTLLDLTSSNPGAVGLQHDDAVFASLLDARNARYEPEPFGLEHARDAVLGYYRARDLEPPGQDAGEALERSIDHVCLCASTSEAYAFLFALLCDPGDVVLVPTPGYPLLEFLADLHDVALVPYPLLLDEASSSWRLDLDALRRRLDATPRVRAIVTVAPNNPTGNYLDEHELRELDALCRRHRLSLWVDEVFYDYPLDARAARARRSPQASARGCLTFTLSGLSKVAALPQLKLSWILCSGPEALVDAAMARLELIADSFLGVATPVQHALPQLLLHPDAAPAMQDRIRRRIRGNLDELRTRCRARASAITLLPVAGGWTALVRLPSVWQLDDEGWALDLIERAGVRCQPGYLFGLDDQAGARPVLALSLLVAPETFQAGVDAVLQRVAAVVACGP